MIYTLAYTHTTEGMTDGSKDTTRLPRTGGHLRTPKSGVEVNLPDAMPIYCFQRSKPVISNKERKRLNARCVHNKFISQLGLTTETDTSVGPDAASTPM